MNRHDVRDEQPKLRPWRHVLCSFLALALLLSPAVVVRANGPVGGRPAPASQPIALVMMPLALPDDLLRVVDRVQQSGFTVYEHLGNKNGEFILAGVSVPPGDAIPDAGVPMKVLASDITQGSVFWVSPPRGQVELPWNDFGVLLFYDGEQALLRTTDEQAEHLAGMGAEIVLLTFQPLVFPEEAVISEREPLDYNAAIQGIIDQVTSQKVTDYTAKLSGVNSVMIGGSPYTIATRHTSSGVPIQKATQYVGEFMAGLGYTVTNHSWSSGGYSGINVIGERLGATRPNEIYIIGAHLDDMPSGSLAPGADDNASGSAATMLAAEIFSHYTWDVTIRFAFWTGEEQGLRGSSVYAAQVKNQGQNIRGYLNLDMIAYNGGAPNEINLFWKSTVPSSEALVDLFIDSVSVYQLNLAPVKYNTINYTVGNQSDNKPFWDQGYAAMLAIEDYYGDFNPYYHTVNDRLQYADMAYFTDLVKASLATFAHMANGPVSALAVNLASLDAVQTTGGVEVAWETTSEIDNAGFHLYRGLTPEQPEQRLAFVPSQAPGSSQGAAYTWFDADVAEGQTVWYWLSDESISGVSTWHGPVSVHVQAPTAVTTAGITSVASGNGSKPWAYPVLAIWLSVGVSLWIAGRRPQRTRELR